MAATLVTRRAPQSREALEASVTTDSSRTISRSTSALNSLCRRAWVIDGPINRSAFDVYVETQLAPTLLKGDVDVLLPAGQHQQAKNKFSQQSLLWNELSPVGIIIHELTSNRTGFQERNTIFMTAPSQHRFSGTVAVFQERRLPETATPAGYSALPPL
jgi:hypothetical protein